MVNLWNTNRYYKCLHFLEEPPNNEKWMKHEISGWGADGLLPLSNSY